MRPMIRLGNLNARPSCPAAAPGSTVWVYLYAAGHRDMPGDSPAGNGRLSGIKAQDGKIADACAKENRRLRGTDGGQTAWRGAGIYTCMNRTLRSSTYLQSIHQRHSKTAARKTGGGWICGRLRR